MRCSIDAILVSGLRAVSADETAARLLIHGGDGFLSQLAGIGERYERGLRRRYEPVDARRAERGARLVQAQSAEQLTPEVAVVACDDPSLLQPGRG
jgi:hypothetical protein